MGKDFSSLLVGLGIVLVSIILAVAGVVWIAAKIIKEIK